MKDDLTKIRHMLDSSQEALSFIASRSRADLNDDRMLTLSLIKSVEIVGEAAARITNEFQKRHPEIPWRNIIGMRNRLTHAYFDINLDVLWNTIVEDLPPLVVALEKAIMHESQN